MTFVTSFVPLVCFALSTCHRSFLACSSLKSSTATYVQAYSVAHYNLNLTPFNVHNIVNNFRSFSTVPTTICPTHDPLLLVRHICTFYYMHLPSLSPRLFVARIVRFTLPLSLFVRSLQLEFCSFRCHQHREWIQFIYYCVHAHFHHIRLPSPYSTFSSVLFYPTDVVYTLPVRHSNRPMYIDCTHTRSSLQPKSFSIRCPSHRG